MRPLRVEFVYIRGAKGPGHARSQGELPCQPQKCAQRSGDRVKGTRADVPDVGHLLPVWHQVDPVVAEPGLDQDRIELDLLEHIRGLRPALGVRGVQRAPESELLPRDSRSDGARCERPPPGVPRPRLPARDLPLEKRSQDVRGFPLVVPVPRVAPVEFNRLEAPPGPDDAAKSTCGSLLVRAHRARVAAEEASGDPVIVRVVAKRAARVAPVVHPRCPGRHAPRVGLGSRKRPDGRPQVPSPASRHLDAKGDVLCDSDRQLAAPPDAPSRRLGLERGEAGRAERHRDGHLVPNYVDHPAECAATVENRAWSTNHVDPPSRGRGERRGVVRAAVDDVTHPLAVFKHQDPVSAQAADDRLGGARPHAGHGYARNRCNRLRDGCPRLPLQLLLCEDGGGPNRLVGSLGTQDRRDDNVRQGDGSHLKVDCGQPPLSDLDGSHRVPEAIDPDPIRLRIRHSHAERPVAVRNGAAARIDDHHHRARERRPAVRRPDDPRYVADGVCSLLLDGCRARAGCRNACEDHPDEEKGDRKAIGHRYGNTG